MTTIGIARKKFRCAPSAGAGAPRDGPPAVIPSPPAGTLPGTGPSGDHVAPRPVLQEPGDEERHRERHDRADPRETQGDVRVEPVPLDVQLIERGRDQLLE